MPFKVSLLNRFEEVNRKLTLEGMRLIYEEIRRQEA
jgi:hypothetical protein